MTAILLMGVSGSGKTTVGTLLATALGTRFVDADSVHSEANRQKMAAGIPLNDTDRAPWLAAVGVALAKGNVVVACSALRRRYRDGLRLAAPDLRLVYLRGNRAVLVQHLAARRHEFMPPELLDSQLDTLEPPAQDEHAIVADIDSSPSDIVAFVVNELRTTGPHRSHVRRFTVDSLKGGCHCGNLRVEMRLSGPPDSYRPRACDCDFCRMHGASYVSDPLGSLVVRIKDDSQRGSYRQGSGQADLMYCRQCGVLVGATYSEAGGVYATINSRVMDGPPPFGPEQTASPKTLTGEQKATRWRDIWFGKVTVVVDA